MSRAFQIALAALLTVGLLAGLAIAQPKCIVKEPDFNYGNVPQNAAVVHGYWIYNTGNSLLQIKDVKPGCGCTKAPMTKTEIAPNDSAEVELIFNSGRFKGAQHKSATVMSNDSTSPNTVIRFSVYVDTNTVFLAAGPLVPSVATIDVSSPDKTGSFTVKNVSAEPKEITAVSTSKELFDIKFDPAKIAPNSETKVKVTYKPKPAAAVDATTPPAVPTKSITFEPKGAGPDGGRFTIPIKF